MNLKDRKGRFNIPAYMVAHDNYVELLSSVFASVQVVRVEYDVFEDMFIYQAYSKYFDEISVGKIIPEYYCKITGTKIEGWIRT